MIPERLDILGKYYAVQIKECEASAGDYGECFVDDCRIEVASFQCNDQKRDALLHEAMHAVDHELHCSMNEAQIRRMATGLLALLRQNRPLVDFLLGSD